MRTTTLDYLEATVRKYPDKVAVVDRNGSITFSALDEQSKRVATGLINLLDCISEPIGIFLPKSKSAIISFIGVNYSGCFYVPIDIKTPQKRLIKITDTLKPSCIITDKANLSLLEDLGLEETNFVCIEDLLVNSHVDEVAITQRRLGAIDTDPVYSIFTSGSTGNPKGVLISHRGVLDYVDWAQDEFEVDDTYRIGNQAPFYFDNSTLDIYLMMATGACLILVPEEMFIFPVRLLEYLNEMEVSMVFWVPSVLITIANMQLLEKIEMPFFKKILFAGEVMPNRHLNYWRRYLPKIMYANLYGPTEITVDCTFYIVDREFRDDEPLPIGVACRNTGILILNNENKAVTVEEIGELCVRGSSLAHGYYNDWEKTKSAFIQNPLNDKYPEIIYRTGDLVFQNKRGEIIFVGRKDSQIKHNGYRIELGEIETAALATQMMKNACSLYDFGLKEITLFYQNTEEITLGELRYRLIKLIPKYMMPTKLIKLDKFPLNQNGKIDRKVLKNKYIDNGL